jgi:hypothetical protein
MNTYKEEAMINPAKLFKIKSYGTDSPKSSQISAIISAVQSTGIAEGTVIEVNIQLRRQALSTNVRITESDKQMFEELAELSKTM